jgi:predicted nucleic acid-binding protein
VIVVDASILANVVGDDGQPGRVARTTLAAESLVCVPDLADVETTAVLRKSWLTGSIDDQRFFEALQDLGALPLRRCPTGPLMLRAYELRANVTPCDAAYVALAEEMGCVLVTADGRLSRAPGLRCPVQVVSTSP